MDEREELEIARLEEENEITELEIAKLREKIEYLTLENEREQTKWLKSYVNVTENSRDLRKNIIDMEESRLNEMIDFYLYHYVEEFPTEFEEDDVDFDDPSFLDWFLPQMLSPPVVMDVLSLVDGEGFALFQTALEEKQEITYTPFQGVAVLVELGFLFLMEEEGTYFVLATEDIKKVVEQIDLESLAVMQKKNQELLTFTVSAVHLYGAISFADLFQIQQGYGLNYVNSPEDLEKTIEMLEGDARHISLIRRDYVSHGLFEEFPEDLFPLVDAQQGKPRYVPDSLETFLEEGSEDFYASTSESEALFAYVETYQQDEIALDNLIFMLELGCLHNEDMDTLFAYFEEFDSLPERKKEQSAILDLLIEMEYHSRKWVHNGLSACALDKYSEFSIGKKQKPQKFSQTEGQSKNGPCPCGSGKKFKRCCGK